MSNRSETIWTYRHSRQKAFIKAAGSLFKLIFPCKCLEIASSLINFPLETIIKLKLLGGLKRTL